MRLALSAWCSIRHFTQDTIIIFPRPSETRFSFEGKEEFERRFHSNVYDKIYLRKISWARSLAAIWRTIGCNEVLLLAWELSKPPLEEQAATKRISTKKKSEVRYMVPISNHDSAKRGKDLDQGRF